MVMLAHFIKKQLARHIQETRHPTIWPAEFQLFSFLASVLFRRRPEVWPVPDDRMAASLSDRVAGVDPFRPTAMCRIMAKHGSDKGQWWRNGIGPTLAHNYTTVYSLLFQDKISRPIRIFELGLGTNNPNFAANMGERGRPGASLRAWRDIFPPLSWRLLHC
jgi:hypothetical protein